MPTNVVIAVVITLLPLTAWAIEFGHAFLKRRLPSWTDLLSTAAITGSLILSLYLFFTQVLPGIEEPATWSATWFKVGSGDTGLALNLDIAIDNLTIVMFCVVSIVACLVHYYSRSYMHDEDRYPRFFFYLSLFSFSMLALCTTSNILMLFIFWELVGVCSYFLIGFFIQKKSAGDASKKAFVMNRIGDGCFMAGIFFIFTTLSNYTEPMHDATAVANEAGGFTVSHHGETHETDGQTGRFRVHSYADGHLEVRKSWGGTDCLSFSRIWESVVRLGPKLEEKAKVARAHRVEGNLPVDDRGPWDGKEGLMVIAGILLFMGCVTKSAQFPLHIWLPDAMEGPTPVSALIHAATMVAAGVYMVCRMFPIMAGEGYVSGDYFSSPALWVIAGVGAITAFVAGTIAIVQTDLKKGLAYSTVSQLGYMVAAVGCGSIVAAMFHLFTHAFFKACLFLGSGSAIHAVHSQEMSDMGGLRKKMPITSATFLISCFAIAGTPFFSGFMSKEAILGQTAAFAVHMGTPLAWAPCVLLCITAVMTTFYMFRLYFLSFEGEPGNKEKFDHAHESPKAMTIPLMVLAGLAVISAGIASPIAPEAVGGHWFQNRVNDEVLVKGPGLKNAATAAFFGKMKVHSEGHGGEHGEHGAADEHGAKDSHGAAGAHDEHGAKDSHGAQDAHAKGDGHSHAAGGDHDHGHGGAHDDIPAHFAHIKHEVHIPVMLFSLSALIIGIGGAFFFFMKKRGTDFVSPIKPLAQYRTVLQNLYYIDFAACKRVVPSFLDLANIAFWVDKRIVDGFVNLSAKATRGLAWVMGLFDANAVDGAVRGTGFLSMAGGGMFRRMVNGKIQDYVKFTAVAMGVVLVLIILAG